MAHAQQAQCPAALCVRLRDHQPRQASSRQGNAGRRHIFRWRQCRAALQDASGGDEGIEEARERLSRMMRGHEEVITGEELRQLIVGKWGRSYDVRLQRRGSKVYLHVMWKHLEQRSFHLTAAQYQQQLDAVAEYLQLWGVANVVREGIARASPRGPGFTGGGSAKAVSIPLVESSAVGQEWDA